MISTAQVIALTLAAIACAAAACTDIVSRRVPNAITLPLLAAAPIVAALSGVHAALVAGAIVVAALLLGTFLHAAALLGGGDVKLLAGVSALAGFPACIDVALYTALCGGVLALVVSAVRGELGGVVARMRSGAFGIVMSRSLAAGAVAVDARGARLPYAVAIAAGFLLATAGAAALPALRIVQ